MNILNTQKYLQDRLPGFSVTFNENYKGKPNTRFVFEKGGVDAAVLLANKLNPPDELLDNIAAAVEKKFEKSKDVEPTPIDEVPELERQQYEEAKRFVEEYERKHPMT